MGIHSGVDIIENGLVACLDGANFKSYTQTGTAWTDVSLTGNNGILQNNPTFSSLNGGNFSLDGTDDRVLINCAASTIRLFDSSIQFVIRLPLYSGGQRCILSYRSGSGGGNLYIGKGSGGIFCYYNELNNPGYTVGSITDNTIAHCVVTCDATNNTLSTYINGTLAGSATRTGWVSGYNTRFYLGWDEGGTNEYMLGNLYYFSHYNRVLTAAEVLQNFNALRGRFVL
jgi:hypothetical protein